MQKVVIAILLLLCLGGGFMIGSALTLNWVAEKMVHFLDLDIDRAELAFALEKYKHHIDLCYPEVENALILNDTRD